MQFFGSLNTYIMNHRSIILVICFINVFKPGTFSQTNTFPSSGNVGIGTTSPSKKLEISCSDNDGVGLSYSGGLYRHTITGYFNSDNSGRIDFNPYDGTSQTTRMSIRGDGKVGIGTTSPSRTLQIKTENNVASGIGIKWSDGEGLELLYNNNGYTNAYIDSRYDHASAQMNFRLRTNGTPVYALTILGSGNVGIGTTNPQNKLDVNGTIRAKEIIATLDGWADYVFDNNYKLLPLGELEKYIITKNKLPEVPSEKEVIKDGVSLGEMNALLLKKIEELTLYLIEVNKKSEKQSTEIEILRTEIKILKSSRE